MDDQTNVARFATLAIHAGARRRTAREASDNIFLRMDGDDHATAPLGLDSFGHIPAHASDATVALLEERIAALEGGSAALALASGSAAQLVAFGTLMQPGDEMIVARRACDERDFPFVHAHRSFGWNVQWADPDKPETFVDALTEKTKAIRCASLAAPDGAITDLEAIARIAQRARVPFVVDNTLATPYLVRPFEHGADIVLYSSTGFLEGGHGQHVGGLVVDGGTFDWADDARFPALSKPYPDGDGLVLAESFGNFAFATACRLRGLGPELSAFHAFLVLNGIETLPLRMQRHCENALAVAQHLSRHPGVSWVRYAGLPSDPGYEAGRRYCPQGTGAVLTFGLDDATQAPKVLLQRLKLFSPWNTVGDTRSHAHARSSPKREPTGIADLAATDAGRDTIHLSVGLEDKDDIIGDLDQALGR